MVGIYTRLKMPESSTVVATFSGLILVIEANTIVLAAIGAVDISCKA